MHRRRLILFFLFTLNLHLSSAAIAEKRMVEIPNEINGVKIEFASTVGKYVDPLLIAGLKHILRKDYGDYTLEKVYISSANDSHRYPSRHVNGNAVDVSRINGKKMSIHYPSDAEVKTITDFLQNGFESYVSRRENFGPLFLKKNGGDAPSSVKSHSDHIHLSVSGEHPEP